MLEGPRNASSSSDRSLPACTTTATVSINTKTGHLHTESRGALRAGYPEYPQELTSRSRAQKSQYSPNSHISSLGGTIAKQPRILLDHANTWKAFTVTCRDLG
jgi:hypothetical protein